MPRPVRVCSTSARALSLKPSSELGCDLEYSREGLRWLLSATKSSNSEALALG